MSNTESTQKPVWTKDEIRQFDRLVDQQESRDQVLRISGRLQLRAFVKLHGQPKCDAMFAQLEADGKKEDGPLVEVQS